MGRIEVAVGSLMDHAKFERKKKDENKRKKGRKKTRKESVITHTSSPSEYLKGRDQLARNKCTRRERMYRS